MIVYFTSAMGTIYFLVRVIVPRIRNHKTKIEENDELLFFAKPHNIKSIESLFK